MMHTSGKNTKRDRERNRREYQQKEKVLTVEQPRKIERDKKRRQAERKRANEAIKISPDIFVTPQSLGKAVKRVVISLPNSSPKKASIVSEIVKSLTPKKRKMVFDSCNVKKKLKVESMRKKRSDALSEDVILQVQDFYQQDGISRILPGKKDCVSVKTDTGREHRQKRLLLMNISEAHAIFEEESGIKLGLTKFSQLRPPQV